MIDHIGLHVSDIARATEFYLKALAPLGYGIVVQVSAEDICGAPAVGFGADQKPSLWIGQGEPKSGPMHVAFVAPNRAAVDAFYEAAIRAGGKDNADPDFGPNITPTITEPSCSIRTATTQRRCATCRNSPHKNATYTSSAPRNSAKRSCKAPIAGSAPSHRFSNPFWSHRARPPGSARRSL